jgi:hypothetical protein
MKIMAMKDKRVNNLRQELSKAYGVELFIPRKEKRPPDIQEQSLSERRQLIQLINCILTDWPSRFIMHSRMHRLWSSVWLRHIESGPWERSRSSPFWFWNVVHEHLYRAKYSPSEQEIKLATEHLKSKGDTVNKAALARLLGISVIRNNLII